jgi:DNA (cytosine-5)-methyltransferase 1
MSNFLNQKTMKIFKKPSIYGETITFEIPISTKPINESPLRVITLFSGYGSQEIALKYQEIDHIVVGHSDICEKANQVFDQLHDTQCGNLGDITKINENDFPDCDLLTFSFPCQSLSIAGKQEGIKVGTQSGLLFEVERIIRVKTPKYLMMENVKNLVSERHLKSFERHLKFLHKLGYTTTWKVLNGADFGCPQNRERVIMMAELNGCPVKMKRKMKNVERMKKQPVSMRDFVETNVNPNLMIDCEFEFHEVKNKKSLCKMIAKRTDVTFEQTQRIYSIDGVSPCLTKTMVPQIMTDEGKVRKISARESYRFMGIKDEEIEKMLEVDLKENQHSSLAGNAICVPVLEALFKSFFKKRENLGIWSRLAA